MKGIVIYDTSFGNTRQIAEAIAEMLKKSGIDIDIFCVKDAKKLSAKDYDFLVIGSPTRWGTMSFAVKRFLGKLKAKEWRDRPFAAFDTENPENLEKPEWSAAEKIAAKLKEKQMSQLLPVLKSLVTEQTMKGPLKEGEIERAKKYAADLAANLKKSKDK